MLSADEQAGLGRALMEDLPDAVIYADYGGTIRYWNAGAARIFGYNAAEAVGQSLDLIIPERLRARHWEGFHRVMATGESRYGASDLLSVPAETKSDAALSVQFTVALVRDEFGAPTGIVALLRDVTHDYQELKRLRARPRARPRLGSQRRPDARREGLDAAAKRQQGADDDQPIIGNGVPSASTPSPAGLANTLRGWKSILERVLHEGSIY
jgi:PAS domain S-box-containing protein